MKAIKKILLLTLTGLVSCYSYYRADNYIGGWKEKNIKFTNSIPHVNEQYGYFELLKKIKWGGIHEGIFYETNDQPFRWIRKPENLTTVHHVLMNLGYDKFLTIEQYNQPMKFKDEFGGMLEHHWEGLTINQVMDNLIKSYNQSNPIDSSYYTDFWKRRASEGNDYDVFMILNDIQASFGEPLDSSYNITNDTLTTLLKYDLELQNYGSNPSKKFLLDFLLI